MQSVPKFIILIFTYVILNQAFGQESSLKAVDSLEKLLAAYDNEFQRAYVMCDLAKVNSGQDSVKAYEYGHFALNFFKQSEDSLGLGRAYDAMAFVNFDYNEMFKAQHYYEKAKEIFGSLLRKDSTNHLVSLWSDAALNLAAALANQGKSDEQILQVLQVAPIADKHKNYKVSAVINTNLGIQFVNEDNFDSAYSYFKDNDLRYEQTTAYPQYAVDRLVFTSCLLKMDSLDTAKQMLDKAYSILQKIPDVPQWQMYYQSLGEYHSKIGNYNEALRQFDQSVRIIEDKKAYGNLPQQYLQYVETYALMGNKKKEKEYMLKFYEEALTNNPSNVLFALKKLAAYEEKDKNYKKSLDYINSYFKLNDSLQKEELSKEIYRLAQQYQNEKKEREIVELKNKNYETDLALEKRRSQNYLLYFLTGTLVLISLSGYLTYRNRQKKSVLKEKAQQQEIQNLKSEQQKKLFGVMMNGVEQERKRLALELHDGLGGRLSGISIKLSKLSENGKDNKTTSNIDDILGNLDDSLQELRGIARNLKPETLTKYGLKAALEDYCSTLKRQDINIVLQYYSDFDITDKSKLMMVYRIIQELINNAIKHSKASEILVQYIHDTEKIDITVEDDGLGFKMDDVKMQKGMGLANLENRVAYLNGIMDIRSEINEGTTVQITIVNT